MHTQVITNWSDLSVLEKDWNQLLVNSNSNTIFLTWEWIQAWRGVVGEDKDLFVVCVKDDNGKLIGVAPFYKYKLVLFKYIEFKALRVLADYATGFEYGDWIVEKENEEEILLAIADELKCQADSWDLIWMPRVSGWSGADERLEWTFEQSGLLYNNRVNIFSALPLPKTNLEYEETFSSKRRQQLRRNRRKLLNKPEVNVVHCESHSDLPLFIETLFDLHHKRRMLLNDPGCFARKPAEADFYRQFLPKALDNNWLRISALTHNDEIQAIQVGYAYNGDFLQLQEGFNPDYTKGAGNVLRQVIIEDCINEGLKAYDFLGEFTEHKRRWGAIERTGYDYLIGHKSLKNRIFFLHEFWPSGRYISEEGLYDGNIE